MINTKFIKNLIELKHIFCFFTKTIHKIIAHIYENKTMIL